MPRSHDQSPPGVLNGFGGLARVEFDGRDQPSGICRFNRKRPASNMLSRLKTIFDDAVSQLGTSPDVADCEHAIQLAAAALLVEMSRADHEVSEPELVHIRHALVEVFDLTPDEVEALMDAGASSAEAATSLYEFTSVVNERFGHDQKVRLVEFMWRIAYADGELEKHEAHLVRRVADLLHLRHREYIGGKLRAEQEPPRD